VRRRIVNDEPGNHCFGCSPRNARGLQLVFEQVSGDTVEARYEVGDDLCGTDGVAHGGIQATLLDEVMGMAVRSAAESGAALVTAEFQLRYRRPVRTRTPVILRARLLRAEPPSYWVEAQITGEDGELLTRAEARWQRIGASRGARSEPQTSEAPELTGRPSSSR
jgi:uncharacterized protein (TIGR00369 family)